MEEKGERESGALVSSVRGERDVRCSSVTPLSVSVAVIGSNSESSPTSSCKTEMSTKQHGERSARIGT